MNPNPDAPANPSYREVCSGETGFVEVLHMKFDSKKASYEDIIKHFYTFHDPTTPFKQGHDVGTQYSSVIFVYSPSQRRIAQEVTDKVQSIFKSGQIPLYRGNRVCTAITDTTVYYPAEAEHQRYLETNPNGYCNHLTRWDWNKVQK